jgi:hypothetical protein
MVVVAVVGGAHFFIGVRYTLGIDWIDWIGWIRADRLVHVALQFFLVFVQKSL